jgi:hypothetical protein
MPIPKGNLNVQIKIVQAADACLQRIRIGSLSALRPVFADESDTQGISRGILNLAQAMLN